MISKFYPKTLALAFVAALRRFNNKNGWVMSSHVAMSMMLALFPFVLFSVALTGSLTREVEMDQLIELVFGSWPDQVAAPIEAELRRVLAASGSKLITLGGFLGLYFASNGVDAVRVAMTQAYREDDPRSFWHTRLLCLLFVIMGGAALLLIALIELILPFYASFMNTAMPGQVSDQVSKMVSGDWMTQAFVIAVPVLGVLACHLWLPGHPHSIRQVLPGVILTVVLWGIAGWGFAIYVGGFASYSATYAGLAGAMAALIFLYLNSAILILGAEFNGALLRDAGSSAA